MPLFEFTAQIEVELEDEEERYEALSFKEQMAVDEAIKQFVINTVSSSEGDTETISGFEVEISLIDVSG